MGRGQVLDLKAAAAAFDEALTLRRRAEDARGEASTLANLARLWILRGDVEQGQTLYRAALDILRGSGHPLSEAKVLLGLGEVALERQRHLEAEARFLEAGELYRGVGDATGEAESLAHLARARQTMGRLHDALRASARGLELLEDVRPRALAPSLRTSFFALAQSRYDLHVDLLLELHAAEPDGGHDLAAFQVAERARARSLLDLLDARGGDGNSLDVASIRQEEDELIGQIAELDRQRLRHQRTADESSTVGSEEVLPDGTLEATTLDDIERRLSELLDRLDTLHGLRQAADGSVESSKSMATAVADLDEIRRMVHDAGADLMVLRLSRDRGVRWTLTESGLETHRLPPRREVEPLALRVHGLLSRSHRRETLPALASALEALSTMLLADSGAGLRDDRPLVVVPDGALHYVPFALLAPPGPAATAAPRWLDRRVVVTVPSASIWTRLQARAATVPTDAASPSASVPSLAVVADPVFSARDPRLEAAAAESDGSGLRRLEASRREAESLVALAPGRTLQLFGFDADKQRILRGELEGFDYLHFATHGTLDVEHPELSGIVLSQVDRRGRPRDGILRMLDISRLDLRTRLVVLSACETALGESVRGEGLMGLSRAFFAAGTDRLIVSLWKVSDGGTAALMERVYRGIFVEGLDPPAALRRAQLDLATHPDYGAPYFWAGFVAVGAD